MPENTDIEKRLKRLEQLHIWGATFLAFAVIGYIIIKRPKKH